MLTIKQIEALFWVSQLGTLTRAAERLHITQSAATKRLQDVESIAAAPLFESGTRKAALTLKGREVVAECRKLLAHLEELDRARQAKQGPVRLVRIGLTELTAMTWLPRFIMEVTRLYPQLVIQPEIGLSSVLGQRVKEGKLDLAFIPFAPEADDLVRIGLGTVPFGWFGAADMFDAGALHQLQDLARYPVVEQGADSIITELCAQLWEGADVRPVRIYGGDNIHALAGLVSAGVGISCLPVAMFEHDILVGRLQLIATAPAAPRVPYHCCFLKDSTSDLGHRLSDIAGRTFSLERGLPALSFPDGLPGGMSHRLASSSAPPADNIPITARARTT
jgi:DNA-binding transcriptional LysR family regulator